MSIEQPELGNVGVDQAVIQLHWTLERGWDVLVVSRLSGASSFSRSSYAGQSAEEAHGVVQDLAAEILGLL